MEHMMELMLLEQEKKAVSEIISCNERTEKFGLILSEDDVHSLITCRRNVLKDSRRVEFGKSVLPEIIYAFCDSDFMNQENYTELINELQEIFYLYKNESMDELTDDELIGFMRRQFDEVCYGDTEYLKGTCLERFARAVRTGFYRRLQSRQRDEYAMRDTENEYGELDEETRWEWEVYCQALENME